MRKLFILFAALFAFVACTQNEVEELTANRADAPETLTVGFEGGDTRVELNEALKTVWTEGDEVSVYFYSDANQKWQYQGETGERLGTLRRVDASVATTQTDYVVVAYPYNTSYTLNRINANLIASLPAVQSYKDGSYGSEGNIMVAQSEFTQFSLKSVCGWLRVELTGEGEVVESVKVRGNNGEQVAGLIYVDTATAESTLATEMGEASDEEQVGGIGGGLEFDDTVFTEVTLDCGSGVMLGAEATAFYIALLPQTFAEGLTIEVNCAGYKPMTLSTESSITIERNHIVPMEAVEHDAGVILPSNELWYTATEKVEPNNTSAFNVTIVSNEWDEATGKGIITFDGELTTIGDEAFRNCYSLTSVTIPNNVTTIGISAFYDCTRLTSVTIGDSVMTIGHYAFSGCESLTSVRIPDSVTTIEDGAFASCHSLAKFKGKFAADGGRCLIKDNAIIAYANASGATYTIPDSVTTIGDRAFDWCDSLTSVTIGDSVTTIGDLAFYSCRSLASVTIGDGVTTIGEGVFFDCNRLTSVTIPDSVTTIGAGAFRYCGSLSSVYCEATTPPTLWDSYVFYSNADGRKIYVPAESVDAYKSAPHFWSEYAADIVGYNFETGEVVAISNKLFYTATAKVEPFDTSVFNVAITSNEWDEATGEGVITFDGKLTTIGDEAFDGCESLTSVIIPDSVTTIGEYAFRDCNSLTSVTIGDSVKTIGDYAFYECDSLTSVTIGDNVTTIGNRAFMYCYSLTNVTIPDSVTTIGNEAFYQCQSLTSVTIGDSVTTIGEGVFRNCSHLTSVTIPDSVTTIGINAFYYCRSLSSVYCEAATPPTLGDSNVFDTNASDRKIYVPAKSVWAYKLAENWREYADYIVGYDFETGEVVE